MKKNTITSTCLSANAFCVRTVALEGTFVIKIFDAFSDFTISLLYLVGIHFETMAFYKPTCSRPFNSEQYVIFRNRHRKHEESKIVKYLELALNAWKHVNTLLPSSMLSDEFYCYVKSHNLLSTVRQCESLYNIIRNPRNLNTFGHMHTNRSKTSKRTYCAHGT